MYLIPETQPAHDAFWSGVRDALRARGIDAPNALTHDRPLDALWGAPDLVLSHICNLPYRLRFRERVTRIASADYGLEGCRPGYYRALFVVRDDHSATRPEDLDGATMAYNAPDSHSGWGAPAQWAEARGLRFRPIAKTGGHDSSLNAVSDGLADFAAIDAQSYEILKARAARLRVIGATDPSPGMTFITRAGSDPVPFRSALEEALETLPAEHRARLGVKGFKVLPEEAYDLPLPPRPEDWGP